MNDDYFAYLNEFSRHLDFVECIDVDVCFYKNVGEFTSRMLRLSVEVLFGLLRRSDWT